MAINLRHLAYLVAAAKHRSITGASQTLGVSQPAISAAIKSLEDEFGFSFGFLSLSTTESYQGEHLVRRPLKEQVPEPWVCLACSRQMRPMRILSEFMQQTREVLSDN